jgi:autotransporter-associated beta strand protein
MSQRASASMNGSGSGYLRRNQVNEKRSRMPRVAMAIAMGAVIAEISPLSSRSALADATWTGATNQDWNTATNWTNNAFPSAGVATIDTSTGNFPVFTGPAAFTPTDIVVGGVSSTGRLDVRSGTISNGAGNWTFLGRAGGSGTINLADTTNTTTNVGALTGFGMGSGNFANTGNVYIGGVYYDGNGTGVFNVNTSGSFTANLVDVADGQGNTGVGTLNIDNGTVASAGEFWTGAGGVGVTNQDGGTATSASWFVIGRGGQGTYNLMGGTLTANGTVTMASFAGANGTLNMSGGVLNAKLAYYVGEGANGTVNLSGNGVINVTNATLGMRLGVNSGATGQVNLNGGVINTPIVTQGAGSGTFNFNGGTLRAAANNGTFMNGLTQANVRNGGAVIDSNGFGITIGQALAHSTIGGDNATDGGLTKIGAGSLTVTANNSFTGPTNISAGALIVGGSGAINSTSGITVNGATARFASTSSTAVSPIVTLTSGAVDGTGVINTVNVASSAANTIANGAGGAGALTIGALTFSGAGNFNLNVGGTTPEVTATTIATSGTNNIAVNATNSSWSPGTYDLIGYGALAGSGFSSFQKGNIGGLSGRQSALLGNDTTGKFITLTIAGDNPKWTGGANSNWTTTAQSNPKDWQLITSATATDYISGDVVLFDDSASNFTVNVTDATVTPTSTTFNNTNNAYTLNGPGSVAGNGALIKNGAQALTINSSNTYSGGTQLNAGTLNINNASAIGTGSIVMAGGVAIDNTSGGSVTLSTNNPQTWNGNLTFGGSNDLNLGTGSVTFTNTTTVTTNGNAALTIGGNMNGGASGLVKQGTGKLILTGVNNYSGSTVLNQGTLQVAGGSTGAAGTDIQIAPNATDNGTLVISAGTLNAFRVIIAGASSNVSTPGTGVVTQTGGVINSAAWFTVGSGNNAASTTAVGTYNLSGGTLNLSTQQMEIANFAGTSGAVNMNGGAINVGNSNFISMGANNNAGNGTFTQNAGTVTFFSDGGTTVGGNGILYLGRNGAGTGTYVYSLNGGVLNVPQVTRNGSNAATSIFNFNGGTLKAATNGAALMSNLTAANVQTNGAIIDTNGNSVTMPQALSHDAGGPAIDGGLTKNGVGTLRLSGVSTYTGPTTVNGGILQLASGAAPQVVGKYTFDNVTDTNNQPVTSGSLNDGYIVANSGTGGAAMNGVVNNADNSLGAGTPGGSIVPGKFGNALQLDSFGSSVDIPNRIVDQSGTATWTLSLWVKTTQQGSALVSKNAGQTTWQPGHSVFYLGSNPPSSTPGSLPTAVRNSGGFLQGDPTSNGVNVTDGNWHMLTFVDNSGTKAVFVDGALAAQTLAGYDNADTSTNVRLGYNTDTLANLDGNVHLAGDLDQVEFFNGALNAAQIGTLFNTDTVSGGGQQYLPTNTALNLAVSGAGLDLNDNSQVIGSLKGVGGTTVALGQGVLMTGGDNTSTAYAGVISGSGGIIKTGTGTFTMTGSNTYTGGTTVNVGKLIANNLSNGTITVTGGQAQLSVKANNNDVSGTTVVPALSITGGSFDITNNALVLTSANTSAATVRGYLHAGSLTTSSNAGGLTVGYADNATLGRATFGGVNVDNTKVLVGLVYGGDANLDGKVNALDFNALATNFGQNAGNQVWTQGDFNYDGSVNTSDFTMMSLNFGKTEAAPAPVLGALVPEPGTISLLAVGAMGLLARRRRGA